MDKGLSTKEKLRLKREARRQQEQAPAEPVEEQPKLKREKPEPVVEQSGPFTMGKDDRIILRRVDKAGNVQRLKIGHEDLQAALMDLRGYDFELLVVKPGGEVITVLRSEL